MRKLFVFTFLFLLSLYRIEESYGQNQSAKGLPVTTFALTKQADDWLKNEATGFTENKGQIRDQNGQPNNAVKYLLNMNGLNVQLRANGFSYDTWIMEASGDDEEIKPAMPALPEVGIAESLARRKNTLKFHRVDIELKDANPQAEIVTELPLPGYTNKISGPDIFSEIHSFKKVTYKNIYPGIDLEFLAKKGTDKPVEYNFIVHPGADASAIKMQYNGADKITLANGEIEMKLAFGTLKEKIPASFVMQTGQALNVQYKTAGNAEGMYAFNVPAYDKTKTLIIDPTPSLVWATYLGGVEQTGVYDYDRPSAIRVDNLGNVVVLGTTSAANGIASGGVPNTTISTATYRNSYIAKYTAAGVKTWACYVGGNVEEMAGALAIDGSNNIYMAEGTVSTNLSIAGGSGHNSYIGGWDIYVTKLSPAGAFQWGNYMGGSSNNDFPLAMEILPSGNLVLSGNTVGGGAAIAFGTGYDQTFAAGGEDGYILTMNATTGAGIWGTYVGGPGDDYVFGLTSDAAGNIYFSGNSSSTSGITTAGSFQPANGGSYDGFIGKVNSTGSTLSWCTYYGGAGADGAYDVRLDKNGDLIVGGVFASPGFGTAGKYQSALAGSSDGLIMKMSAAGAFKWATYYGGTGFDVVNMTQVDENNNIYISGYTASTSGIATNCSYQPVYGGGSYDCFIGKLDSSGSTRFWGSYFGGANIDQCNGTYGQGKPIAYTSNGVFYMAGYTFSAGLATGGAADVTLDGQEDAFIAKFTSGNAPQDVQVTAQTLSPLSQTSCSLGIPAVITGNLVSIYNPATFTSPIFYQWQVTSDSTNGPWTDLPGEVFKDITPLSGNTIKYYRRKVLVNDGFCDKKLVSISPIATVNVTAAVAPIANANGPQWFLCSSPNTITLNGSATASGGATISSYNWYAGSNLTTPVATTANYTPTNITAATTYTLKVTDNNGCTDIDQVTVTPVVANAGPDQALCQGSGGVQIGTAGIAGGSVTYSWAIVSGTAGSLSCTSCAQPIATPAALTKYALTVTVTRKDGSTCTTTDTTIISFVAAPTNGPAIAGTDKTICKSSSTVLGNGTPDPSATYSWAPANYLSNPNIGNPTFNAGISMVSCPLTYTVTAVKSGCSFTDQVNVSVINPQVDYESDTTTCYVFSEQLNEVNCGNATYAWQVISGPGVVQSTMYGGAAAYLYNPGAVFTQFQRITTLNGVSCPSTAVTLAPCGNLCPPTQIKVVGDKGCPKVFGSQEFQLYIKNINPAEWNFAWTPVNLVDNATAPVVTISATTPAIIDAVIINKITGTVCPVDSLPINDPAWVQPTINTPDKHICPNTPTGIGELAGGGYSYDWSPTQGLTNSGLSNPLATLSSSATYNVVKTDNVTGCSVSDEVNITVGNIDFDAGNNRTICNGATVTLGTTPGGNYTYNWQPAGAAWTNGTSNTSANPQVLFAGATQTFTVTVTDTASGCTKTDTVTLSNSVTTGEYAGSNIGPICPGTASQLGRAAEPNATYLWSPTTGLSCTTCANPVVTAGIANQTYTLTVSYPGCSTPVTDQVTVSVKPVPSVVFNGRTVCPSTPTNIGVGGGGGNSTSIAGVASYDWSPTTALSCTNCASPLANPQAFTIYTATLTLTNGCVISDTVAITPTVTATAKPDATICPGSSVQLGSPSQGGITYAWSSVSGSPVGTLSCTNCAQPVATPTVTTVYRLTASGSGCTITDDVQITVKSLPAFTINGNTSICTGGSASLSAAPVAQNTNYQWSPTAGVVSPNSSSTIITPVATTTYRLTQTDINSGCSDYKEVIVSVSPNNVSATGSNMTICPNTSDTLRLNVSPATGNTISWSPATGLSNPFVQNPQVTPLASSTYIATVINNTTNCADTAVFNVTVPASCTGNDYGDAPAMYDAGIAASHGILNTIMIGSSIDAEGVQVSSVMANGDDLNQVTNDEEGISFLPGVSTASKTVGVLVNSVLNNTGKPAYLVAWIDFNRDGDFSDPGEQSSVLKLASSATASNPVLQFSGFNAGCVVTSGPSYLRVRLTTDTSGGWNVNPSSKGARTDGEVEDYAITIYGTDFSDAPLMYPTARATVNPDLNNDGKPDAAGSVWLGAIVDYPGCDAILTNLADGDDNNGMSDEDGLNMNGGITSGNTTATWDVTVNSQGPVNNVQWGMWVDWNTDGVFDDFFHDSVNTASPVIVPVSVTSPASIKLNYIVRLGVKTGTAFTANDYSLPITNGEWEDFIAAPIPLNVALLSFTATKKTTSSALLQWQTAHEEQSDYFAVEHSTDARTWSEIGRVAAAVKSATVLNYSLTDYDPFQGVNYYRLRMADKDGNYKLSSVRQLTFDGNASIVTVMPNPAHDAATVVFSKPTEESLNMKLIDAFGRVVTTYGIPAGSVRYTLSLDVLPRGIYYLDVKGNTVQAHLKLVVQ
ncbi:GEVED domain-containing protein [Chitinophagaceae bacterium MMS25-I14]